MSRRTLGGIAIAIAVLGGCTSASGPATATCVDDVGDVRGPYGWTDVRSATVTVDGDAIEADVEFARPLPDDADGEIRVVVGILDPPPKDRSVLGDAEGTAFLVAAVNGGSWRFGALDGRRNDVPLAEIGDGEVDEATVRWTVPTSRVGRTGEGSGWHLEVQPRGMDVDQGDRCPGRDGSLGSVDF
jgi:hypothetical protein